MCETEEGSASSLALSHFSHHLHVWDTVCVRKTVLMVTFDNICKSDKIMSIHD